MAALLAFLALPLAAQAEGSTIVSLDYCADQFVMGLADPDQILAVSKDAARPFSHLREKAAGLRKVRAAAEDVIALRPDIVVRSWGGDARALGFYESFGIETVQIGYATDLEGAARVTQEIGDAIGQPERAAARVAAMPAPAEPLGIRATYLTPSGVSAGAGTMVDSILTAAGLTNAATRPGWHSVDLEALVLSPPDVALTAFFDFDNDASDQWSASRHPVLQRIMDGARTYSLDESRLTCPAWFVADEAADLRRRIGGEE
ncbi:MAG: ABC transporter substrate-binding protein [Hyphomonas sp.]|nr:ABC transporter substrate-binding protein [Hyphomonas sp.]